MDNFPSNRDQWNDLIDRGVILPDDVIVLREDSPKGNFLIQRWYEDKRAEIDQKTEVRLQNAEAKLRQKEVIR